MNRDKRIYTLRNFPLFALLFLFILACLVGLILLARSFGASDGDLLMFFCGSVAFTFARLCWEA